MSSDKLKKNQKRKKKKIKGKPVVKSSHNLAKKPMKRVNK